jgi:hypothetical protein
MAKTSGLGDDFYFGGYRIGGDIQQLTVGGGPNLLDVTDITQLAHSRLGGQRSGQLSLTAFSDATAGQEHAAFSGLSRSDIIATYLRGQALGNPAAACSALQLDYDYTRAADGMLTEKIDLNSDQYGLEWGIQLTAGLRSDTTATTGTAYTDTGQTAFGGQAYLQIVSFTGTSVDVTISASTTSGGTYATLIDFTSQTGRGAWRVATSNSATCDQYLKVNTAGTFSQVSFQVTWVRNQIAGVTF